MGPDIIVTLSLTTILALLVAMKYAQGRPMLNFGALGIMFYILVYPISGMVHILRAYGTSGGYYAIPQYDYEQAWHAALLTSLGAATMSIGLLRKKQRDLPDRPGRSSRSQVRTRQLHVKRVALYGLVLTVATLPSLLKIRAYAASTDTNRIIALSGGLARVGFLAQWCAWGIVLVGLALIIFCRTYHPLLVLPIWALTALVTALALDWTGGRTVVIIFLLPLAVASWPMLTRPNRLALVVLGAGAALSASIALTAQRAGGRNTLGDVLDWQAGRFSMIGFALRTVRSNGYLHGETLLAGALQIPNGILQLFSIAPLGQSDLSITQITGAYLLNNADLRYIVPGFTAEIFINFGWLGVALAYLALGMAFRAVDDSLERNPQATVHRFRTAYLGTVLLFCTLSSQSGALFNYTIFIGLPVLLLPLMTTRKAAIGPTRLADRPTPLTEARVE